MSAIHLSEHFDGSAPVGSRPTNVHEDEQEDFSSTLGNIFWKVEIIRSFGKCDVAQRTVSGKRKWIPGSNRE